MIADWHLYCDSVDSDTVISAMTNVVSEASGSDHPSNHWFYIRYFDSLGYHIRYRDLVTSRAIAATNEVLLSQTVIPVSSWTLRPFQYEATKWGNSSLAKSLYLDISHLISLAVMTAGSDPGLRRASCLALVAFILDSVDPDEDSFRSFLYNHYSWWSHSTSTFEEFAQHSEELGGYLQSTDLDTFTELLRPLELRTELHKLISSLRMLPAPRPLSYYLHQHVHLLHNRAGLHFTEEAESMCALLKNRATLIRDLNRRTN